MKKLNLSNFGFSLLEVLIAASILGGLSMVLMKNQDISQKITSNLENNSEITAILSEMRSTLSSPDNCDETFKNLNGNNTPPGTITSLKYKRKDGTFADKFQLNEKIGNGYIKINSFSLSDSDPDVALSENTTNLLIDFYRGKKSTNIIKKIKLFINTTGVNINNCRSFANADNQLWQRNELKQENIFYESGSVAIGKTDADSKLDVNGEIKISATNAASKTCAPAQEGAIRYNSNIKKIEFCDGSSWRNSGGAPTCVTIEGRENFARFFIGSSDGSTHSISDVATTVSVTPDNKLFQISCREDNGWIMTGCTKANNGDDNDLKSIANGCQGGKNDASASKNYLYLRCCKF